MHIDHFSEDVYYLEVIYCFRGSINVIGWAFIVVDFTFRPISTNTDVQTLYLSFFPLGKFLDRHFLHTKERKLWQNRFCDKVCKFTTKKHKFSICGDFFYIIHMHARCGEFHISPHLSCGDIWNYSICEEILEIYTLVM